ncbi:MAG: DNA primase [Gaiellales bacterium]|nr:MAG: DNA primase [Gaiellales bacterium]
MALITQSSIQSVLDTCDMLDLVAPYVTLKKTGSRFMGRCPFHEEKTGSFSVDPAQKLYYCFGCGEGGNAITFVEKKEGLDFADAVRFLAEKYGVSVEYEESSPQQEERRKVLERDYSILDQAATYYSRVLWESDAAGAARDYLRGRGFSDSVIREFRLGFSPASGEALIKAAGSKGYRPEELQRAGLVRSRNGRVYDYFRGRLMFPFTDHRGRVLGFGARVLGDGKPKYINSPDSHIYHKSGLLFGLGNARQSMAREDRAYVVEGYTDVIALRQTGIANAVASMGTALTGRQLREVSRFTRNLYLAFDADAAGQQAMLRVHEAAAGLSLSTHVVNIPAGKDPAELVLAEGGKKVFDELAAGAPTLLEYQVHAALSSFDLGRAEERVRAFPELKGILEKATDPIERDELLRVISDGLRLSAKNVAYLMESASQEEESDGGGRQRRVLSQEEIVERNFLSLCLARPGEAGRFIQEMTEAHFTSDTNRTAFNWVRDRLADASGQSALTGPYGAEEISAVPILPELVIRAETEMTEPDALPETFLRLCEAELRRRIGILKAGLAADDESSEDFQEMCRLERRRRKILEMIQSGSYEAV